MNVQHIQAMIALNAARIAEIHAVIDDCAYQAQYDKKNGDGSFAADEYRQIDRERVKLRKAVELQRAMKAEMAGIAREGRIARKILLVKGCVDLEGINALTSYEQEAALDKLIVLFVPKKPDSRVQSAAQAA